MLTNQDLFPQIMFFLYLIIWLTFDFYIKMYKLSLFYLYQHCFALCPELWQLVKWNCFLQNIFSKFISSVRVNKINNSYLKSNTPKDHTHKIKECASLAPNPLFFSDVGSWFMVCDDTLTPHHFLKTEIQVSCTSWGDRNF